MRLVVVLLVAHRSEVVLALAVQVEDLLLADEIFATKPCTPRNSYF